MIKDFLIQNGIQSVKNIVDPFREKYLATIKNPTMLVAFGLTVLNNTFKKEVDRSAVLYSNAEAAGITWLNEDEKISE